MFYTAFANKILQLATGKLKSITGTGFCYLGFSSTTPNADGSNVTEPDPDTYPSYGRKQLNVFSAMPYADVFGNVADGVATNVEEIATKKCQEEGGWPTFTHFVIYDSETATVPIAGDWITDPDGEPDKDGNYPHKTLTVPYGEVAIFEAGTLRLGLE